MALLLQFLTLLLGVGAYVGQCPPPEDILPCLCVVNNGTIHKFNIRMYCWKVDDVEDVRRPLQSVQGIERVSVIIRDSRLGAVPSDLFKGLNVTELTFDHCDLITLGDEGRSALEGLEDIVEKLSVESSFSEDNALKFLNVSGLRALDILDIRGNYMKDLGDEWFAEGPANLKELHISENEITSMGDWAFAPLTDIRELWMSRNRIEMLKRSMFPSPALHLRTIFLSDNNISSLPVDLFSDMPELKHVYLDNNSIQRIPEATWIPVWNRLEAVDLDVNPLNCDADIEWTLNETRPKTLRGKCVSPDERKEVDLKEIIDEK